MFFLIYLKQNLPLFYCKWRGDDYNNVCLIFLIYLYLELRLRGLRSRSAIVWSLL